MCLSTGREKKRLGKEQLQRVIDLCRSIEEKGVDPFLVDVNNVLRIIQEYFPDWENPEELCLDAEAVHEIASAIKLQSEWVKHRSTSLYTDPFLIEEKLRKLPKQEVATIFLKSWHPIVELEQISPHSLTEAMKYWQSLIPIDERWQKTQGVTVEPGITTREELLSQQIIAEKEFSKELEAFWHELRQKIGDAEKIEYWDFVGAETYEETVRRAYMTSFLTTYGFATMEVDRLEEVVYIKFYADPIHKAGNRRVVSLPISISMEEWNSWKESRKN
jgi:hypothetical protein